MKSHLIIDTGKLGVMSGTPIFGFTRLYLELATCMQWQCIMVCWKGMAKLLHLGWLAIPHGSILHPVKVVIPRIKVGGARDSELA